MRRVFLASALALAFTAMGGGAALASAGPEWCDDGSPPPNDFRFRPTGGPSAVSSTKWEASTTSGTLDLKTDTNTLTGGVARGMNEALAHAGAKTTGPRGD